MHFCSKISFHSPFETDPNPAEQGSGKQYCQRAITMLWSAMESELWEQFLAKKSRNLAKCKPERFRYLAEALPEVIASKRILVDEGLSSRMDFKRLEISKENYFLNRFLYIIKMDLVEEKILSH
jgi:hypothetical protein